MSPLWGSNPRPYAYEAHALPAELKRLTTLALLQKYNALPCNLARLDCFKLGITHASICSFLCFGWCLLGGAVLPEGQEAAAGKGPKLSKKLLGRFGFFFLFFFVPFWGFGGSPLFGPNPLKRRRFALPGFFVLTSFSFVFSRFFRSFFCCFLGFGGSPLFGPNPLKRRRFALPGFFCRICFSWVFLFFAVSVFIAFLLLGVFGGSPLFGQKPLKHRGLALLALLAKFPFLGLRALSQAC